MRAVRHTRFTILLTLLALLAVAVALPTAGDAKAKKKKVSAKAVVVAPMVGVADNNAPMFHDPNYQSLGGTISRRITPYDFYKDPVELGRMDAWMKGAWNAGIQPLIAFEHSYTYPTKLPSVAEYAEAVTFAIKRYPNLRTISPWNEANHKSQPTVNNPKRAAQYYNMTRVLCPSCTIVAADVLDQKNMVPWITKFKKYAKKPKIWGLHSYTDSNGGKTWNKSTTKAFLATVTGDVWLTEVGGIVAFNYKYGYNEARASKATVAALNLGLKSPRIKRIYLYCWFGSLGAGGGSFPYIWDSGMVSPDGAPRPAYYAAQNWMKTHPQP